MDFQDGETKVIGGTTYVRQGGMWNPQTSGAVYGAPAKPDIPSGYQSTNGGLAPIPGGPADKPPEPKSPVFVPQGATQMFDPNTNTYIPVPQPAAEAKDVLKNTIDGLGVSELLQSVSRARNNIKTGWATGAWGALAEVKPGGGTPRDDFLANLNSIKGSVTMEKLQALKDASKTGASGMGALSEKEGERLASSLASLSDQMSPEEYEASFKIIERHAKTLMAVRDGKDPSDPAVAKQYGFASDDEKKTFEQISAELKRRVAEGEDPSATIQWLVANNYPPNKETIDQILANRGNPNPEVVKLETPAMRGLKEGIGGVVEGAGDIAGMVSSPFIAGVNAVTGSNYETDVGKTWREGLGLPEASTPGQQFINAAGGAAMIGGGLAGAARAAAPLAGEALSAALARFGAAPAADAAISGASGGSADIARQAGGGPVAQTAAALAGGLSAAPLMSRITGMAAGIPENALLRAGQAENVTVPRAMAFPSLAPNVVASGKTMTGARIARREMQGVSSQIESRTQALGQGGTPLDNYNLGEKAQGIGKRYIAESGAEFKQKYADLREASGGVTVPAGKSIAYIDDLLGRLGKAPATNKQEIEYLQEKRADLAGGVDVETSRDIGSRLAKDIRKGDITFGPMEGDVLNLRKTLTEDVADGLSVVGKPRVAAEYRQVDTGYQQRMDFIQNTVQKLTGRRNTPLPAEQAAARIQAWAGKKGDSVAFGRIMSKADPEEHSDIAATFADALGKNNKGDFSTNALMNNGRKLSARAKGTLFGPEGQKSLENLEKLAKEHDRVSQSLGGSPTALAHDARGWMLHALFGIGGSAVGAVQGGLTGAGVGGVATGAAMMAAKMGKDTFSARALMSPKITGWLRTAPRSSDPEAINTWFGRLESIAVREPALAPEIKRIQDAVARTANENFTPSAAALQPDESKQN